MDARHSAPSDLQPDVPRRYVEVAGRAVHYRVVGSGPAIVMLHDSPRSSRLHLETARHLSRRFQVFALDTPGYGNSTPLPLESPSIPDFAAALAETLDALGLQEAPLYATHTSAKIALEYATAQPARTVPVILDGLSIPVTLADPGFIAAYMRPFVFDDAGGYLAAEWTRMRDMLRWFPWFDHRPSTRMPSAIPDDGWIADYLIDLLSAGPSYSSAYGAAMAYDPMPALLRVTCPVHVAAKPDDVLYASLDRVPLDKNPALTVERIGPGHDAWMTWLEGELDSALRSQRPVSELAPQPRQGARYVDLEHGAMRVHRAGPDEARPVLILSAPTTLEALAWQAALPDRATLVPELPGFGESTPLPEPSLAAAALALAAMLGQLGVGEVDLIACGFATPLGAVMSRAYPDRVRSVVLDGCYDLPDAQSIAFAERLCPDFGFDLGGGHLHRIWHMLRDSQVSWPWHDRTKHSHRALVPQFAARPLHDALVGILKQPAYYGDVTSAGCRASREARYPAFAQPALLLRCDADPAYAGTGSFAARLPRATMAERPQDLAGTARLAGAFLKQPQTTSAVPA
jgi:pimeloyl-ACP methyl ester carboxylesterase